MREEETRTPFFISARVPRVPSRALQRKDSRTPYFLFFFFILRAKGVKKRALRERKKSLGWVTVACGGWPFFYLRGFGRTTRRGAPLISCAWGRVARRVLGSPFRRLRRRLFRLAQGFLYCFCFLIWGWKRGEDGRVFLQMGLWVSWVMRTCRKEVRGGGG